MAFGQPVDFNYFLAQKYALLRQQADADTQNAGSQRIQANSNAEVGTTTAALNRTTNQLAPAESVARNAAQLATARLTNVQADVLPDESLARIGTAIADIRNTDTNRRATIVNSLVNPATGAPLGLGGYDGSSSVSPALARVFGGGGYQGFRLGSRF